MTRFEEGDQSEEHQLVEMEHYRLGPAPFGVDIRADAGRSLPQSSPKGSDPSPLAGIQVTDR